MDISVNNAFMNQQQLGKRKTGIPRTVVHVEADCYEHPEGNKTPFIRTEKFKMYIEDGALYIKGEKL